MASRPVNRRKFLQLTGAALIGAGLNACSRITTMPPTQTPNPTTTEPPATPTPPPVTPIPAGSIHLNGGSADVWDWKVDVSGYPINTSCSSVQVQANGQGFEAEIGGDRFKAAVPLQPGENLVSASCSPAGAVSENVTYSAKLRNQPTALIDIRVENGKVLVNGSASQPAPVDPSPVNSYCWSGEGVLDGLPETSSLEITPSTADGEYFLSLTVTDANGRSDTGRTYFVVENGRPRLDDQTWENTNWVEDAVVYGIIPRKFGQNGFKSIEERLDALQDLGINAVWLAPINRSPDGDYGYAVTDYFELREKYGTKEDFKAFVQAAHQRGIRVLMDFVPNHSSNQHRYFLDAQEKGPESHYWTYYDRDENGQPTHYFSWANLPNLNYSNSEVDNWITEAFSYWVREFDVDGFRVDACWGVKQRKPDYWPRWRAALKRIKPDLLLLAEASAHDEYYFTQGFDAAYDWTDQLGKWAWERVFDDKKLLLYNLNLALTNNRKGYHEDALVFRFLNNNDTGGRFITLNGLEMTRVATTLLLTLPGIPCVYTGDEIGASYTPYGDPLPLNWDKDPNEMYVFHKKLIHLRHDVPALHSRKWQFVKAEPHIQVLAYLRYTAEEADPVLVLLNFSDQPAPVVLDLPEPFKTKLLAAPLRDLLSEESVSLAKTVDMPPYGARILSL